MPPSIITNDFMIHKTSTTILLSGFKNKFHFLALYLVLLEAYIRIFMINRGLYYHQALFLNLTKEVQPFRRIISMAGNLKITHLNMTKHRSIVWLLAICISNMFIEFIWKMFSVDICSFKQTNANPLFTYHTSIHGNEIGMCIVNV